jgi:hypothetical protein
VALAAPAASMASQPDNPGGFGKERASNIQNLHMGLNGTPGASSWGDLASDRAGDNGTINNDWKASHGFLPVESSHVTP